MEEQDDSNKVIEDEGEPEEYEFKYNFINIPWDDRTKRSKIGIVALLVAISVAIMALVINDFVIHYKGFNSNREGKEKMAANNNCHFVKMDKYAFVARIFSIQTKELLCVGAVVSEWTVLANEVCVKSGPIQLELGISNVTQCQFNVETTEIVPHDGVVSHNLVLLTASETLKDCSEIIPIGNSLRIGFEATVIGRSSYNKKSLTRRIVAVIGTGTCRAEVMRTQSINQKSTVCVRDYSRCPALASDLLIQDDHLYGLASTSSHRDDQKVVLFANLELVRRTLKELEPEVLH